MRPSTVSDKSRRREPVAARDRWTHGDPAYPIPGIDRADHGPNNRRMLAHVMSAAGVGVEAVLVRVEVDVVSGLPQYATVGLPASAVRESRERVRSAIRSAGFKFPDDRITVNRAPADIRKEGAAFDLPIALGILTAIGCARRDALGAFAVVGELALDGQVQAVRGALAVGLACRRRGVATLLVPRDNAAEATAVAGMRVVAVGTLGDAVAVLNGEPPPPPPPAPAVERVVVDGGPSRAPHHPVSVPGLIGGGSPPRPGEVTLAHRGVLFLDELPEFQQHVLESLRQPLEDGRVAIARSRGLGDFPACFQLVAAANPCRRGCPALDRCVCTPAERDRYLGRLSGPLLDRIDLHVELPALEGAEYAGAPP